MLCGFFQATSIDTSKNMVTFGDGSTQTYSKLFIATGGLPRQLNVPGKDLSNIFYLRSPEDANKIRKLLVCHILSAI